MRYGLFLLILVFACTQPVHYTDSSVGTAATTAGGNGTSSTGSNTSNGVISSAVMKYKYPNYPGVKQALSNGTLDTHNPLRYFITSVADASVGVGNNVQNPKDANATDIANSTDSTLLEYPINFVKDGNGQASTVCFSNDIYPVTNNLVPPCQQAAPSVTSMIGSLTADGDTHHPVLISAIQFNFKDMDAPSTGAVVTNSDNTQYSQVVINSIYVEKAPVVFIRDGSLQGTLAKVNDSELTKITYYGGGCDLTAQNSVGFDSPTYMPDQYYLSGIWSFERPQRAIFGEGSDAARFCATDQGSEYCNLFADKVDVFHSIIIPLIYTDNKISHRQYPNETIATVDSSTQCMVNGTQESPGYYPNGTRCLVGTPSPVDQLFGKNVAQASGFTTTPVIGKDPGLSFSQADSDLLAQTWQQTFITKLCINGYRRETDSTGHEIQVPLINAMRAELRSPHEVITYSSF